MNLPAISRLAARIPVVGGPLALAIDVLHAFVTGETYPPEPPHETRTVKPWAGSRYSRLVCGCFGECKGHVTKGPPL